MKRSKRTARLVAVLLAALSTALPPAPLRAQEAADAAWQSLFNGRDLGGWKQLNGAHHFEAIDGEIVGTTVPGEPNGFLVTEQTYGDFVLELEVRPDLLMNNSGVQFRSLSHDGYRNGRVHGYQAEIDTKPQRWSGSIYDEARRGWMYILESNPAAKTAFVNNQWNHYRIEAIGNTNRIWVNGIPTAHLVDDETTRGFIGLQLHANNPEDPPGSVQIRFRNIRIQTENLEPSPYDDIFVLNTVPNYVSPQEAHQGFELLWDGETTRGWRGAGGSGVPAEGWAIRDGVLSVTPSAGARDGRGIMTVEAYGPFELKFEYSPDEEGGICGVEYLVPGNSSASGSSTFCRMATKKVRDGRAWNQAVIRVSPEGFVEYWLNGYEILAYRRAPGEPSRGRILLRGDGDAVSYRSMKIRALD